MSKRSFEMYQYRQDLLRMRQGDSDREIARSGLMGRPKAARHACKWCGNRPLPRHHAANAGPSKCPGRANALRARIPKIEHLYAALDEPTSNVAATAWLSGHLDAVLGPESDGADEDLPQLPAPGAVAAPLATTWQLIGITPQEGRAAPTGHRLVSGGNPAADPSRNPANASANRHSAQVHDIGGARTARGATEREFDQHSVFGRSLAVHFECGRHSADNPTLTVNLKAAAAKDGADCTRGWTGTVRSTCDSSHMRLAWCWRCCLAKPSVSGRLVMALQMTISSRSNRLQTSMWGLFV